MIFRVGHLVQMKSLEIPKILILNRILINLAKNYSYLIKIMMAKFKRIKNQNMLQI